MLDSQVMDVSASGGWLIRRSLNVLGFLICASGLGYAYYAQFVQGFEPCPLCIFQRLALAAVGLVFLAAAVHHPRDWGAKVYGVLIDLVATTSNKSCELFNSFRSISEPAIILSTLLSTKSAL